MYNVVNVFVNFRVKFAVDRVRRRAVLKDLTNRLEDEGVF